MMVLQRQATEQRRTDGRECSERQEGSGRGGSVEKIGTDLSFMICYF